MTSLLHHPLGHDRFDPNTSIVHLLHRVSQIVAERFAKAAADDITIRQLLMLAVIGSSNSPSQTHLVTATGVDRSTTADIIRRLVQRRLVSRKRSKFDARAYELTLTAEGSRVLLDSLTTLEHIESSIAELVSPSQRAALAEALALIVKRTNTSSHSA